MRNWIWISSWMILLGMLFNSEGVLAVEVVSGTQQELVSPDGHYRFRFYQKQDRGGSRQMYYTVSFRDKTIIEESELGVLVENQLFESALGVPNDTANVWCSNMTLREVERSSTDENWTPLYGERSVVKNRYNEMTVRLQKGEDGEGGSTGGYDRRKVYKLDIIVRAYNEGVAFRYHFPETVNGLFIHITGEQSQFNMPEGTMAWYERWAQGPYEFLPLENWTDESERPLTLQLRNGIYVALGEAQMTDFVRMKFRQEAKNSLRASLYGVADVITPYSMPWRVVMAAEKPGQLIENNDIILNLNPPLAIEKTDWIKPGKVIRIGRLTQEDAFKYVDFAADHGLQYVHIDAGWYGPEMKVSSDATTVDSNRNLNMEELCRYAGSKGLGVWVYVNQRALFQQLDEILPLYKQWGIKGIKFGFVQIGNQYWTNWLHEAVKKCAEYEMLVDIHDEYRPTGFSRTYPNLLTQEGIHGNEEYPDATHNTVLPFTRYLAGAGDYTVCYYSDRLKNTHAHQLALSVVCYSPLQFLYWYDHPSQYEGEPEIEFFDQVPTVWDDTKVIDGEIGETITIARRSGEEWYMGILTNNEGRKLTVPMDYLPEGQSYVAHIYTDNEKVPTKTKVGITRLSVDNNSVLQFNLKPRGGCAIRLVPATKEDLKKYKRYKKNQPL